MSAAFDFLINTAGGLLMNLGVSGMVGHLIGVGATRFAQIQNSKFRIQNWILSFNDIIMLLGSWLISL